LSVRRVKVRAGEVVYEVLIGARLLADVGSLICEVLTPPPRRIMLVADTGLPEIVTDSATKQIESAGFETLCVPAVATERKKSIQSFEHLHAQAARFGIDRGDALVALGGGIVGDLTGFVAATHRRGVRVIQCPTTLLSMVDASVGGKTGVNLEADGMLLKNFVGSFHQPERVIASVDVLASLDDRQYRSGLAECIKHTMIASQADPHLGDWTRDNLEQILSRDDEVLIELIARNVAIKAAIVASDEHEKAPTDGRALLNLGHTFAHAIETIDTLSPDGDPGNAPLLHGEAVALGLVAAAGAAQRLGLVSSLFVREMTEIIARSKLPTQIKHLPDTDQILTRMTHDKKALGGVLRVVLPFGPGLCKTVETPPLDALRYGIDSIRA
jgi:3-dehydroquinate synthase